MCVSVSPFFPIQPLDYEKIWLAYVDRAGNYSNLKHLTFNPRVAPGRNFRGQIFFLNPGDSMICQEILYIRMGVLVAEISKVREMS